MLIFSQGLLIGLLIALPVGPVAILCIQRTLTEGRRHGLVSGLGAAAADSVYGAVAAFGLAYASATIETHGSMIHRLGGVALCLIGLRTFLVAPTPRRPMSLRIAHAGDFLSTFLLTLMNPMTVLAFAAVFTHMGLAQGNHLSSSMLVLGVFCGSGLWWLILCAAAGAFRHALDRAQFRVINRIAGALIVAFGLWLVLAGFTGATA